MQSRAVSGSSARNACMGITVRQSANVPPIQRRSNGACMAGPLPPMRRGYGGEAEENALAQARRRKAPEDVPTPELLSRHADR